MSTQPLLFAELCAGTAALSLRLHGGPHARPPVSRMGAKTGYGKAILSIMGLSAGTGAGHYLWCDPDPGVRLLLSAYRDHELAKRAAEIIWGWADEEPRALWERLKAEGPARWPDMTPDPREVARWSCGMLWTVGATWPVNGFCGPGHVSKSGKIPFPSGTTYQRHIAPRYENLPTLPATITTDAPAIEAREVARWARLITANRLINLNASTWANTGQGGNTHGGDEFCTDAGALAESFERCLTGIPSTIMAGAVPPPPARVPDGVRVIAYIDPPYQGTTPYAHNLDRSQVMALAAQWAEIGAEVYISEAEPIDMGGGWYHTDITGHRRGHRRTFSKQQAEWVTSSHRPHWVPPTQVGLFGASQPAQATMRGPEE